SRLQKHGSFEDFMIWLARRARLQNWEVHFVFPAVETPRVAELLEAEHAKVHTVAENWKTRAGIRALISRLKKIKPSVVNFHFCERLQTIPVFLACRLMGIRVIAHYHGEIRPLDRLTWRNRHLSLLRLMSFFVNRIVTVSHANQRFLEALHVAA